jgi:hypothetical protein
MGSLKNVLEVFFLAPGRDGEGAHRLHRKVVAMEQEVLRLESLNNGNGHGNGNGNGEEIAHLRASIVETRAEIDGMV